MLGCDLIGLYYLGYERNAWHSTWVNYYYPGSLTFTRDDAQYNAEMKRVQGSVFYICALPAISFRYEKMSFILCAFNEAPIQRYNDLRDSISVRGYAHILDCLPREEDRWIATLKHTGDLPATLGYSPEKIYSFTMPQGWPLGWRDTQPDRFPTFTKFYTWIKEYVKRSPEL